jgi:hypothetical protein
VVNPPWIRDFSTFRGSFSPSEQPLLNQNILVL